MKSCMRSKGTVAILGLAMISCLAAIPSPVTAVNDPVQPPEGGVVYVDGDWNVTDSREYLNCTIVLNDNLFIASTGNLTLTNVTLIVNSTLFKQDNKIQVFSGGILTIRDFDCSNLTTYDASVLTDSETDADNHDTIVDYSFKVIIYPGGNFTLTNSEVHHCNRLVFGGMEIYSDITLIDHCLFTDSSIQCGASATISNNVIKDTYQGIYTTFSYLDYGIIHPVISNNYFTNTSIGINAWYPLPIIENNTFVNNDMGIIVTGSFATILRNVFLGNAVGIKVHSSIGTDPPLSTKINENIIINSDTGIYLSSASSLNVEENQINCPGGYALNCYETSNLTCYDNTIISGQVLFNQSSIHNIRLIDTYAIAHFCDFYPSSIQSIDQDSTLVIINPLLVRIICADGTPIEGGDVLMLDNEKPVYASSGYGGTDYQTSALGYSHEVYIIDRIYDGSTIPTENITQVEVKYNGMTFDNNPRLVNMSYESLYYVFYTETFTDSVVPIINSVFPAKNATGIPVDTDIIVRFSDCMNKTAVESSFSISPSRTGTFSWASNNLTFNPAGNLSESTTYTISIKGNVSKDFSGNFLDGNANGIVEGSPADDYIWSFTTWADHDGDGIPDDTDPDDDNDGIPDSNDTYPNDSSEWVDSDNDGIGDNADNDDDNDGVPDSEDAFPFDADESSDFDLDGTGDNADLDDDNDDVLDVDDPNPYDPNITGQGNSVYLIVAGVIVVLAIVGLILFYIRRKRMKLMPPENA